jgi:two-component system sensor histidine kinase BaeS
VRLTVQDSGAGIAAQDLPYVFDRFWKGDRARGRQPGAGSGLGLAIARQLVQAHGGTIRAESRPGEGAVFTIEMLRGEGVIR